MSKEAADLETTTMTGAYTNDQPADSNVAAAPPSADASAGAMSADTSSAAAPMPADAAAAPPPAPDTSAPELAGMFDDGTAGAVQAALMHMGQLTGRGGCDGRSVEASGDYLVDGLDDLFVRGAFAPTDRPPSLARGDGRREKRALSADFEGEIPSIWRVAEDSGARFLERLSSCPGAMGDDLRERIEEHKAAESEVAQELVEEIAEVRELMQLLDSPPSATASPATPIASPAMPGAIPSVLTVSSKVTSRRVQADVSLDATMPSMTGAGAPQGQAPVRHMTGQPTRAEVPQAAQPRQQQARERTQEQETQDAAQQAVVQWVGILRARVELLKTLVNNASSKLDGFFDWNALSEAYSILSKAVDWSAWEQDETRLLVNGALERTAQFDDPADVADRLQTMAYQIDKAIRTMPPGVPANVGALEQALELVQRGSRPLKAMAGRRDERRWLERLAARSKRADVIERESEADIPVSDPEPEPDVMELAETGCGAGDCGAPGHACDALPTVEVIDVVGPFEPFAPAAPIAGDPFAALMELLPVEEDVVALEERIQNVVGDRVALVEELEERAEHANELVQTLRDGGVVSAGRKDPFTGDLTFHTFRGWMRAVKKRFPEVRFEGDVDIANAFLADVEVGDWDGETGRIYVDMLERAAPPAPTAPMLEAPAPAAPAAPGVPGVTTGSTKTAAVNRAVEDLEALEGDLRRKVRRAAKPKSDESQLYEPVNYIGSRPEMSFWDA